MQVDGGARRSLLERKMCVVMTGLQLHGRLVSGQSNKNVGTWLASRFEDLGPTYIKIGQFIASRRDVYGREFSSAFESMRDSVRPVSPTEAEAMFGESSIDMSAFRSIEYNALATASIAQVHRAQLADGRRVVIKVIRPHVREEMSEDMEFLTRVADMLVSAARFVRVSSGQLNTLRQLRTSINDIASYLDEELDLLREADNLAAFTTLYPESHPAVRVPQLVQHQCRHDAIVMEEVQSQSVALAKSPDVAKRLVRVFVEQLVMHGLLHGDPHAGNIGIDTSGRFVLYDFGSVVRITRRDIQLIKDLIVALMAGDSRSAAEALRDLGAEVFDEDALGRYLVLYRRYLRDLDVAALVAAAERQGREDDTSDLPVMLPGHISRIARSFALLEGVCKSIDPKFNYVDAFGSSSTLLDGTTALLLDSDYLRHRGTRDLAKALDALSAAERSMVAQWVKFD